MLKSAYFAYAGMVRSGKISSTRKRAPRSIRGRLLLRRNLAPASTSSRLRMSLACLRRRWQSVLRNSASSATDLRGKPGARVIPNGICSAIGLSSRGESALADVRFAGRDWDNQLTNSEERSPLPKRCHPPLRGMAAAAPISVRFVR